MNLNPGKDPTGRQRHIRIRRLLGPDLIGLEQEFAVEYNTTQPDFQLTETRIKWLRATVDSIYTVHKNQCVRPTLLMEVSPTDNYGYREARLLDGRRCVVLVRQFKGYALRRNENGMPSSRPLAHHAWWEDVPYKLPLPETLNDGKPTKPELVF